MNELSELVQRRLVELGDGERALSYKAAATRSRGRVSHELIRKIAIGTHSGRIGDRIAEGLSMALELPLSDIYRVARVPRPQSRWEWPARYDRLDPAQRVIVESVASGFLETVTTVSCCDGCQRWRRTCGARRTPGNDEEPPPRARRDGGSVVRSNGGT